MRFAFSTDQLALAEAVRVVLDDHCPPSVVRAVGAGDRGPAAELWRRLADLGLFGALLPEANGGLGLNELDLLPALEETGRAAVPLPVVETAVVAARLLGDKHLAAGCRRISSVVDGSSLLPWNGLSDWVLAGDATAVYLLPVAECSIEPLATVDPARPVARVGPRSGMSGAGWPADRLLSDDRMLIGRARRAGTLATAAQLIGLGEAMLGMTVSYVQQRHQFGVPIGSFQAVKHALADALLAWELARPLVHAAGWAHVHDTADADRDVAAAKIRAGEAAGLVARTALQCHGGMGYTQEHDLHLWLKRTWALQVSWGGSAELRAQVAQALGLRRRS